MADFKADTGPAQWLIDAVGPQTAARIIARVNPRARRIGLRVDAAAGVIVLVRPRRAAEATVQRFVTAQRRWIARQVAALVAATPPIMLGHGARLAVAGEELLVRHAPEARGGVWRDGACVVVAGRPEHVARRLRDWLKGEARKALSDCVREMAGRLGKPVGRITVRDTRSRWGSCSVRGDISLSWRLILAPPEVARYVAAHEVAHLAHLNHSKAFWRTVDALHPEAAAARAWLRRNGASLHRIG
ncbi:MAG: SprT family zinc-dependent metalloprotease [Rhodospirillaceae bacterium]|nr:SprT family zinc-dependent metalloprotease [Rhodospirillaceae bacterium]